MKLKRTERSPFSKGFSKSIENGEVTGTEVMVYTALASFLGYDKPTAFSMEKVARLSHTSLVTAHKCVRSLGAKGWLKIERAYERAVTTMTINYEREG